LLRTLLPWCVFLNFARDLNVGPSWVLLLAAIAELLLQVLPQRFIRCGLVRFQVQLKDSITQELLPCLAKLLLHFCALGVPTVDCHRGANDSCKNSYRGTSK
jgi:hypothetical protein